MRFVKPHPEHPTTDPVVCLSQKTRQTSHFPRAIKPKPDGANNGTFKFQSALRPGPRRSPLISAVATMAGSGRRKEQVKCDTIQACSRWQEGPEEEQTTTPKERAKKLLQHDWLLWLSKGWDLVLKKRFSAGTRFMFVIDNVSFGDKPTMTDLFVENRTRWAQVHTVRMNFWKALTIVWAPNYS